MKIKKLKYMIMIFMVLLLTFILDTGTVEASLQSNPNVHYTTKNTLANWITLVRQIEKAGEAMGLSETLNSGYISTTSNNIDMHMMKSTEYGAIAILSASGYGNSQTLQNSSIKTTTGNKSGVYFSGTAGEHMAAYSRNR